MATSQCPLNYKMKEIDIKVPNIGDFTDVEEIEVFVNEGQDKIKNDPKITISPVIFEVISSKPYPKSQNKCLISHNI